jgi:hypothetical protein
MSDTPLTDEDTEITRVQQEHPDGCVVACYAMLTRQSFAAAFAEFVEAKMWRESHHGLSSSWAVQRLTERGWWSQQYYPMRGHFSDEDDRDQFKRSPWPPEPWAAYHLVCVTNANGFHSVVMLADGTVLDPFIDAPRHIRDYSGVMEVIGLLPPPTAWRPLLATIDAGRRRIAELEAALTGIVDAMDSLHPKFVKLNQYCFTAEEIAAARAALGRTQEAQG